MTKKYVLYNITTRSSLTIIQNTNLTFPYKPLHKLCTLTTDTINNILNTRLNEYSRFNEMCNTLWWLDNTFIYWDGLISTGKYEPGNIQMSPVYFTNKIAAQTFLTAFLDCLTWVARNQEYHEEWLAPALSISSFNIDEYVILEV